MPDNDWMKPGPGPKQPDTSWMKPSTAKKGADKIAPIGGTEQHLADNPDQYNFTLKYNQDNELLRAQNQKWYEQAGLAIGNTVANSVIGLGEVFGTVLDPNILGGTVGVAESDYTNALVSKLQEARDPFGKIYREHPDKNFDLADPGWWFDNAKSVGEWLIPFMGEEKAFAEGFKFLTKAAGEAVTVGKMGISGVRNANLAARGLTAATQAYTEGVQSAAQIYQTVYSKQREKLLNQGVDAVTADDQARDMASKAGATTVKMNTMMNTLLNAGEVLPFFKGPSEELLHWFKTTGARAEGETLSAYANRIKQASLDNPELAKLAGLRHGINSRAAEIVKEGIEEVNTQYAEAEGKRTGEGKERNLAEALTDVSNYFKDVTNSEGALNFVLGGLGGAAFTTLIDHAPSMYTTYDRNNEQHMVKGADGKVVYDSNGQPKYQQFFVSPKTYTERGTRQYFENIKDAVLADVTKQQGLHDKLVQAIATNNYAEAEQIRNQIFAISAIDSVSKGMTENWQEEYKQIGALNNTKDLGAAMQPQIDQSAQQIAAAKEQGEDTTEMEKAHADLLEQQSNLSGVTEAMQKGFAKDMNDHGYKAKAEDAVQDLKHLQDLHDHIQNKYVDADNPTSGELGDHLFFRHADLYLRKRAIEREEQRLAKTEQIEQVGLPTASAFDSLVGKFNDHVNIWNSVVDQMNEDIEVLKSGDKEAIKNIFGKYRAKGTNENDYSGAIEDLVKKIQGKQKLYKTSLDTARQELEESLGYTKWKEENPDGTLAKYAESVASNALLQQDKANLQYVKDQHEIATQNLNELTTNKGISQLYKDLAEDRKKLIQSINTRNKQANLDRFFQQQSKSAASRLSVVQKEALINRLEKRVNDLKQEYNAAEQRRAELETQLKEMMKGKGIFTNLAKVIPIKQEIASIKRKIAGIEAQINSAEHQLSILQVKKADAEVVHKQTVTQQENTDVDETYDADEPMAEPVDDVQHDPESDSQESFYTADELMNYEEPSATDDYIELKNQLPAKAIKILDKIEAEHEDGTPYSYDTLKNAFRPMLAAGEITQTQVNAVQIKLRDYLQEKAEPVEPAKGMPTENAPEEEEAPTSIPETELPSVIENEQPLTLDNASYFDDTALQDLPWEDSAKTTNTVKGNGSDLQYKTIEYNGKRMMRNVTVNGAPQLDPNTNHEVMIPGFIQPGHQVYLEVDTEWNGQRLNDQELIQDENLDEVKLTDRFDMYTRNGKIPTADHEATIGFGNMPIKVVDAATGKTLRYFPRVDWITATQGAGNFRNVEDLMPADADGNREPGNVDLQMQINLRIRKQLAEMYNDNPEKAKLHTTVTEMSGGRVMYHGDLNESTGKVKYKVQLAEKLLTDPNLQFGIATGGELMIGKSKKASEKLPMMNITQQQKQRLMGTSDAPRTSVVAYIPMNNGKHLPVPMMTTPLNKRQGEINTVVRAIELYLQHDTEHLDEKGQKLVGQIKDKTGFDISSPTGLKEFIEQYFTLTNNFSDTKTTADAEAVNGKKVTRWLFAVPEKVGGRKDGKADIKVGTTYSGKKPIRAILKNGKLNQDFKDALIAGLNGRMKNVNFTNGNLKGVNDPRPITAVTINSNDVLSAKTHTNYNAYLKSFVQTSVYGKTQIKDSQGKSHYVYAVNGQMQLDETPLLRSETNARELISSPADAGKVETRFEDVADEIDNWGLENDSKQSDLVKYTIQPDGKELTLENLQQLYNFTTKDDRNTKTPEEVFEHLQSLGISKIADGYNPFVKC